MKAVGDRKTCAGCRTIKPLDGYHRSRNMPDGLHAHCKECVREQNRRWREANPEKKRAQKKPGDDRRYLLARYGLTPEGFQQMHDAQGGACRICGEATQAILNVDHCHKTGRVRGLLCRGCNTGLGSFRDNPDFLASAIAYLSEQQT